LGPFSAFQGPMPGLKGDSPGIIAWIRHRKIELDRPRFEPAERIRIFEFLGQRPRTRSRDVHRLPCVVLAVARRRIHPENVSDRLPCLDFLANQAGLVPHAAITRHNQQVDANGIRGCNHRLPLPRGFRRQSLHAAYQVRSDFNQLVGFDENEDKLYIDEKLGDEPFRFDDSVARVFPDMLRRSIPGYAASVEAIGSLAARYVTPNTTCYDLGCSLGAATLAMRQGIRADGCRIIAVDNSEAMIEKCRSVVAGADDIEVRLADIRDVSIENASMVVMNYTLQFLDVNARDTVLRRIADGMIDGGLFLLSEKVVDENPHMEDLLVDLHHEHKRRNDYSELEISRKRAALDNVLVPETVARHRQRLTNAGFSHSAVWLRYFNFVSIVAIK